MLERISDDNDNYTRSTRHKINIGNYKSDKIGKKSDIEFVLWLAFDHRVGFKKVA